MSRHPQYPNLVLFEHPLILDKMTKLRDRDTGYRAFRALIAQIAGLMVFEVTRTFPLTPASIITPMEPTQGQMVTAKITVVPVLRAGLGMAEGVLDLIPEARLGHIGIFRDERTLEPVQYLSRLPHDLGAGPVLLVDPMLATGGSASKAVSMLREAGATDIRMLCLLAVPEGLKRMLHDHPTLTVYAAALDRQLNEKGYILPGLGDAGDRQFGTG